jgi:hypothetical protein
MYFVIKLAVSNKRELSALSSYLSLEPIFQLTNVQYAPGGPI